MRRVRSQAARDTAGAVVCLNPTGRMTEVQGARPYVRSLQAAGTKPGLDQADMLRDSS